MTKNFLDRFKKPSEKKGSDSSNNNNPLAGWFGNNNSKQSSFGGTGQSLGGSQPGKVIPIELSQPGPLGLKVERRPNSQGTAIVQQVIAGSQAEQAGLERGDVLCFAGSNGGEEIMYDMFLDLAKSDQRPLCFEVRRVPKTKAASSTSNASTGTTAKNNSAEAYARKQAVIAAAEKREKEHKKKSKPIPKTNRDSLPQILSTADKRKLEDERRQRIQDDQVKDLSAATKEAAAAAKSAEQKTVETLGYNPYETKSLSAGQARHAVTTTTHGGMTAADTKNTTTSTTPSQPQSSSIPAVAAPPPLPAAEDAAAVPLDFQQAFETTVTSNPDHAAVVNTIHILRKLIVNATTKGQQQQQPAAADSEDAAAAKFRKIRLANPKIRAAVTEQPGAVDLLLCTGFELHDDSDESVLVYPASRSDAPPTWLPAALEQMEKYVQSQ